MKIKFTLLLAIHIAFAGFAQEVNYVKGIVLDKSNNEPIPYASVGIKGTSIGTPTNSDGLFTLSIPTEYLDDSLYISHVSYRKLYFKYSVQQSELFSFRLEPQNQVLNELVITSSALSTFQVLKDAIDSTRKGMVYPVILNTYYREFTKKNEYFNYFADALVTYYIPQNFSNRDIQVSVPESRVKKVKIKLDEGFDYNFSNPFDIKALANYSNPNNLLKHIKEQYCDFNLKVQGDDLQGNILKISFTPKTNQAEQFQEGIFTIDKNSMMILFFECHISDSHIDLSPSSRLFKLRSKVTSKNIYVQYSQTSGHSYLNRARLDGVVSVTDGEGDVVNYEFISELTTREIGIENAKPIDKKNRFDFNELHYMLTRNNGSNYKSEYWKGSNVLLPTKQEEAAIENLSVERAN